MSFDIKVSLAQSLPASQVDITSVINDQLLALVNQYCAFIIAIRSLGAIIQLLVTH